MGGLRFEIGWEAFLGYLGHDEPVTSCECGKAHEGCDYVQAWHYKYTCGKLQVFCKDCENDFNCRGTCDCPECDSLGYCIDCDIYMRMHQLKGQLGERWFFMYRHFDDSELEPYTLRNKGTYTYLLEKGLEEEQRAAGTHRHSY